MELEDLPLDRISNLPPNIIQTILTLMPIKYAFRTSILSRNWRDQCFNVPILGFNDALFEGSSYKTSAVKWKLLHFVYPTIMLHQGPLIEFSLGTSHISSCCEIDQIIVHLSRSATLKKFTLYIGSGNAHKLLPAFFKFQQLTVLELQNCVFQPPVIFNGFGGLTSLSFYNVKITSKVFLHLISSCLLKDLTLIGDQKHLGSWDSNFAELFECLPLIEHLCMNWYPIKCLAKGIIMQQKLPTSLNLKYLRLQGLSFARENDFLSILFLVTSSPNIETIVMQMQYNPSEVMSQTAVKFMDHQDYSNIIFDHLRVLEITNFTNMKTGMDFVKLILAKSPTLKKIYIDIYKSLDDHVQIKLLKELTRYPRASTRAEIRFERL